MKKKVLLVGAGPMAVDYAKVLKALKQEVTVVGRSSKSAVKFEKETGIEVVQGGINNWLAESHQVLDKGIVAVSENLLGKVTRDLIHAGYRDILLEKPGGLTVADIREVSTLANEKEANVYIGYNRRFFASTVAAKEIIERDGGVTSFNFEFTEWGHSLEASSIAPVILDEWFIQNSSHVIDQAFYVGGRPKELCSFVAGGSNWHPKGSVFSGAGISETGALFSYNANWESAGRWWTEFLTKNNRIIMKPMEQVFIQKRGAIAVDKLEIDDEMDRLYKPGVFRQVEAYLQNESKLMTIREQVKMLPTYQKMIGAD